MLMQLYLYNRITIWKYGGRRIFRAREFLSRRVLIWERKKRKRFE